MSAHEHDASCRELAARLSEYVDGELPRDLVAAVDEHFQACQRCEEFLRSVERIRRLGRAVPAPRPDDARRAELVARLRRAAEDSGPDRI
jgi:anti-sigma factor RsiW